MGQSCCQNDKPSKRAQKVRKWRPSAKICQNAFDVSSFLSNCRRSNLGIFPQISSPASSVLVLPLRLFRLINGSNFTILWYLGLTRWNSGSSTNYFHLLEQSYSLHIFSYHAHEKGHMQFNFKGDKTHNTTHAIEHKQNWTQRTRICWSGKNL